MEYNCADQRGVLASSLCHLASKSISISIPAEGSTKISVFVPLVLELQVPFASALRALACSTAHSLAKPDGMEEHT